MSTAAPPLPSPSALAGQASHGSSRMRRGHFLQKRSTPMIATSRVARPSSIVPAPGRSPGGGLRPGSRKKAATRADPVVGGSLPRGPRRCLSAALLPSQPSREGPAGSAGHRDPAGSSRRGEAEVGPSHRVSSRPKTDPAIAPSPDSLVWAATCARRRRTHSSPSARPGVHLGSNQRIWTRASASTCLTTCAGASFWYGGQWWRAGAEPKR
jgi:hypothetical protein